MNHLLRSLARALTDIVHPRMLWLTAAPFVLAAVLWGVVFWFGWEWAVATAREWLQDGMFAHTFDTALSVIGFASLHFFIAPLLVAAVLMPLIAVTALLLSAAISMPYVVKHLQRQRFPSLEARRGGGWWGSLLHSLGVSVIFLLLTLVTLPLWLIPPLFAILPPLLWGWLAYRVMTYDALALHAARDERRALMRRHRTPLFAIGVATGLLGILPTLVWASSAALIVLFPLLALAAVWLYVWIFVFSALWFAHYCLHALAALRAEPAPISSESALRRGLIKE
ncbi:MAG: EI24 domain-containing protein [Janthinobacterium lividum]